MAQSLALLVQVSEHNHHPLQAARVRRKVTRALRAALQPHRRAISEAASCRDLIESILGFVDK